MRRLLEPNISVHDVNPHIPRGRNAPAIVSDASAPKYSTAKLAPSIGVGPPAMLESAVRPRQMVTR